MKALFFFPKLVVQSCASNWFIKDDPWHVSRAAGSGWDLTGFVTVMTVTLQIYFRQEESGAQTDCPSHTHIFPSVSLLATLLSSNPAAREGGRKTLFRRVFMCASSCFPSLVSLPVAPPALFTTFLTADLLIWWVKSNTELLAVGCRR